MAAPSQRTLCAEGDATPPVTKIPRSAERNRIDGPFPSRHPICSRQHDNARSSCHLLDTHSATTALLLNHRQTNDSAARQSLPLAIERLLSACLWDHPKRFSMGCFPNQSGEPQRLSSGAMDHPTSHMPVRGLDTSPNP